MPKPKQPNATPALALCKQDAAVNLGIGLRKLEEMTLSGEIPHCKIGRRVVYPVEALKKWLERRMEGGATDAPA